jgi:hypothetical protein
MASLDSRARSRVGVDKGDAVKQLHLRSHHSIIEKRWQLKTRSRDQVLKASAFRPLPLIPNHPAAPVRSRPPARASPAAHHTYPEYVVGHLACSHLIAPTFASLSLPLWVLVQTRRRFAAPARPCPPRALRAFLAGCYVPLILLTARFPPCLSFPSPASAAASVNHFPLGK